MERSKVGKIVISDLQAVFKIYLVLVALGLHCYAQVFLSFGEQELLFIMAHRLLAVTSLVDHRL